MGRNPEAERRKRQASARRFYAADRARLLTPERIARVEAENLALRDALGLPTLARSVPPPPRPLPVADADCCSTIGPLLAAGTSGRIWHCEECGRDWWAAGAVGLGRG